MQENHEIRNSLNRILFILENDSKTGRKGLVKEVEDIKNTVIDFIAEQRQEKAVQKAKIGLLGAIGGALATGLWWLITHLFK